MLSFTPFLRIFIQTLQDTLRIIFALQKEGFFAIFFYFCLTIEADKKGIT